MTLLHRMTLDILEINIFRAVKQWLRAKDKLGDKPFCSFVVSGCVKLHKLNLRELMQIVRPSKLLPAEKMLDLVDIANRKSQGTSYEK